MEKLEKTVHEIAIILLFASIIVGCPLYACGFWMLLVAGVTCDDTPQSGYQRDFLEPMVVTTLTESSVDVKCLEWVGGYFLMFSQL